MFLAVSLVYSVEAKAGAQVVPVEGMSYNVNSSLADNVKALKGKRESVVTDAGATFSGILKDVGEHLIHLEKLEGKEYYDALIPIDRISAVVARFREVQR